VRSEISFLIEPSLAERKEVTNLMEQWSFYM
jgi:hypothetical protein